MESEEEDDGNPELWFEEGFHLMMCSLDNSLTAPWKDTDGETAPSHSLRNCRC